MVQECDILVHIRYNMKEGKQTTTKVLRVRKFQGFIIILHGYEIIKVGQTLSAKLFAVGFMPSGTCVVSLPQKLLDEYLIVVDGSFRERQELAQEALGRSGWYRFLRDWLACSSDHYLQSRMGICCSTLEFNMCIFSWNFFSSMWIIVTSGRRIFDR